MILNSKNIFDAHTHIHFPAYDQDRDEVIRRAQAAGVKMITVGTNLQTSKEAIAIAEKYPEDIWATVGIHPTEIRNSSFESRNFRTLAERSKVVAIGECGLDYFRISNDEFRIKEEQKKVFLEQVEIAKDLKKPLMIHCRPSKGADDAYEDLLKALSPQDLMVLRRQIVMHFFVSSLSIAKKLLEADCYFTFGGVITFVRDYDEVIKYLPLENILLETDAPYVTPEPHRSQVGLGRGKRNEPAYVVEVAKKIAEIKNVSLEEVIKQTTGNSKTIFKINTPH